MQPNRFTGPRPLADRFWDQVATEPNTGCWLWLGSLTWQGYGRFKAGEFRANGTQRFVRAHRFSYELLVAPIPEGEELDHLCSVRSCVNPAHLEPVTHAENVRRGLSGKINNRMRERGIGHR